MPRSRWQHGCLGQSPQWVEVDVGDPKHKFVDSPLGYLLIGLLTAALLVFGCVSGRMPNDGPDVDRRVHPALFWFTGGALLVVAVGSLYKFVSLLV